MDNAFFFAEKADIDPPLSTRPLNTFHLSQKKDREAGYGVVPVAYNLRDRRTATTKGLKMQESIHIHRLYIKSVRTFPTRRMQFTSLLVCSSGIYPGQIAGSRT